MIQRRCPQCATFYPKKDGACPECACPPGVYSSHLYTAMLNNDLYRKAESADHEARTHESVHKWSRQMAKELRANGTLDIAAHVLSQPR